MRLRSTQHSRTGQEIQEIASAVDQTPWVEGTFEEGDLCITCILPHHRAEEGRSLLQDLLTRWLIPGQVTPLTHFASLEFERDDQLFSYLEAHVDVRREKEIGTARRNLPDLVEELRLALSSSGYSHFLRGTPALFVDQRSTLIRRGLASLHSRFPRRFDTDLFAENARIELISPTGHRSLRDPSHLTRIAACFHTYRKALEADYQTDPQRRHLRFRLFPAELRFPFGVKRVTGIVVGTFLLDMHEIFSLEHAIKALKRVLPDAQPVQSSGVMSQRAPGSPTLLYFEVERTLSLEERQQLYDRLGEELEASIERLSHTLFVRRNEEETLRTALILGGELRDRRDIPQVNVSFLEQSSHTLTFNLIVLRRQEGELEALLEKIEGAMVHFDWVRPMGLLEAGEAKEASCFCLEVEKEPFLRRDFSVDLFKARRHVVALLESVLGEVRDYNGGLISKQEEILALAKQKLSDEELRIEHLLDRLFYSIVPAAVQGSLPPSLVGALFQVFVESMGELKSGETYRLAPIVADGKLALILRLEEGAIRDSVQKEVEGLNLDPLLTATGQVEVRGATYLAYFYLSDDTEAHGRLLEALEGALGESARVHRQQRTLRINLARYISSLDPRVGGDRRSGILIKMLYEGLTRIGKDGHADLALAESVSISADLCTYTFKLRKSFWTNGTPVTAGDFEYAWKKVLDPSFKQRWTYMFSPIKNARQVKKGYLPPEELGVRVLDDLTLEVQLEHPTPYFLDLAASWTYSPLCRDVDEENPGWSHLPGEGFACNGPFQLAELRRGDQIHLVKNPHYWDAKSVHLRSIDVTMVADPQISFEMFRRGQIDLVGEPLCKLPADLDLSSVPDARYFSMPAPGIFWFSFNTERAPYSSVKLRQALAFALNREQMLAEAELRDQKPSYSYLPEQITLHTEWPYDQGNLEKARQLFDEALDELNLTRAEIGSIPVMCPTVVEDERATRSACAQWSRAFDLPFVAETIRWENYVDYLERQDFQIATFLWYSWLSDPIYNLSHFKERGKVMNYHRWEDPRFSALLDRSDRETEPSHRQSLLREAEELLLQELPTIPGYQERYSYLAKSDLRGLAISDLGQIDFKEAYFASEAPRILQSDNERVQGAERTFRAAIPERLSSLDPRRAGDQMSRVVIALLFEGLMRFDPSGRATPALARKVTRSADGSTYTFELREALWSDGSPVTAHDFVHSWRQMVTPEFGADHGYAFDPIRHAKASREGRRSPVDLGVWAQGDHLLVVQLEHPTPHFCELLANPVFLPVPRRLDLASPDWAGSDERFVCNGPFRLGRWKSDGDLVLRRNEFYGEMPERGIEEIELSVVSDAHTAYSLYQAGEFDWLGAPFTPIPKEARDKLAGQIESQPLWGVFLFAFNCKRPPFTSEHMRRAFALALDRDWLANELACSPLAQTLLPPSLALTEGWLPEMPDTDQALAEFEKGLAELGSVEPIVLSYPLLEGFKELAQAVQRRWNRLFDIPIALECEEWSHYLARSFEGDFQIGAIRWYSWHADPTYTLDNLNFWTSWEDPAYHRLLQRARSEADPVKRRRLLQLAQEKVDQAMPVIPVHFLDHKFMKSDRLQGEWLTPQGGIELLQARL